MRGAGCILPPFTLSRRKENPLCVSAIRMRTRLGQRVPIRIAIRYASHAAHSDNRPSRANVRSFRRAAQPSSQANSTHRITGEPSERLSPPRYAHATLTKHCSNQPTPTHSNNTTSYNPARKLASLLTKSDANLHAGYSSLRVGRAGAWVNWCRVLGAV